jgi:hypothetical protein
MEPSWKTQRATAAMALEGLQHRLGFDPRQKHHRCPIEQTTQEQHPECDYNFHPAPKDLYDETAFS